MFSFGSLARHVSTIHASDGPAVTVTNASYRGTIRNNLHNWRRVAVEGLGMANLGISGIPADYREAKLSTKIGFAYAVSAAYHLFLLPTPALCI